MEKSAGRHGFPGGGGGQFCGRWSRQGVAPRCRKLGVEARRTGNGARNLSDFRPDSAQDRCRLKLRTSHHGPARNELQQDQQQQENRIRVDANVQFHAFADRQPNSNHEVTPSSCCSAEQLMKHSALEGVTLQSSRSIAAALRASDLGI
jgi:hypothetical protein